jgi:uncharacterized phage protein (TIGR01671 family)
MENKLLKFRAYHKTRKEWLFGYKLPNLGGFSMYGETILCGELARYGLVDYLDNIEITQFSGILDKHQKEIYGNDYLKDEKGMGFRVYHIGGGFVIKESVWKNNIEDFKIGDDLISTPLADAQTRSYISGSCEIVGNVYDGIINLTPTNGND